VFKTLTSIRISATFTISLLVSWLLVFNTNANVGKVWVCIFTFLFLIVEINFLLAEKTVSQKLISWQLFFISYLTTVFVIGFLLFKFVSLFNNKTPPVILNINKEAPLFILLTLGIGMILSTYVIYRKKKYAEHSLIKEKQQFLQHSFNAFKSQNVIKFLKESLETTKELIVKNPELAVLQIEKLTRIIRHLLQTRNEKFVSLTRELEIVTEYCNLAELQIRKTVKISIDVDAEFSQAKVPPLFFQMILEHQFLTFKQNKSKTLEIEVYIENKNFIVIKTIVPNIKRDDDIFIQNLKERYRLYKNSADLSILSTSTHHFVKLPLLIQYNP